MCTVDTTFAMGAPKLQSAGGEYRAAVAFRGALSEQSGINGHGTSCGSTSARIRQAENATRCKIRRTGKNAERPPSTRTLRGALRTCLGKKHRLHPAVPYNPAQHNRQSIRLPRWDYRRPGAYFVTTCTHDRVCLSGSVVDGRMALNAYGRIVVEEWRRTERVRDNVVLDAFVVMPNHVYGIIGITAHTDGDGVNRDGNTSPGASTGDTGTNHRRGSSPMNLYGHPNRSFGGTVAGSLSTIMRQFKSMVTTRAERLTK